ncbi:MAG: hypothetical protein AB4426_12090 [Xenococcaceae cyanobacterium]
MNQNAIQKAIGNSAPSVDVVGWAQQATGGKGSETIHLSRDSNQKGTSDQGTSDQGTADQGTGNGEMG